MLLAKCSNSCAACEIRLQFCIAGANESGHQIRLLLRNAQTDLAIRIWTILVAVRLKKTKNGFGPFSYKFFVPIRVGLTLQGKETNFRGHKLTQNKVQKKKQKDPEKIPTLAKNI